MANKRHVFEKMRQLKRYENWKSHWQKWRRQKQRHGKIWTSLGFSPISKNFVWIGMKGVPDKLTMFRWFQVRSFWNNWLHKRVCAWGSYIVKDVFNDSKLYKENLINSQFQLKFLLMYVLTKFVFFSRTCIFGLSKWIFSAFVLFARGSVCVPYRWICGMAR